MCQHRVDGERRRRRPPRDAAGGSRGHTVPVRVREAIPDDLGATAALHVEALHGGLFTRLGPRFVSRWHATHLPSRLGILLVATVPAGASPGEPDVGEKVVGFLAGNLDRCSFTEEILRRHRRRLARTGVFALLTHPRTAGYFLRTRAGAYGRRLWSHAVRSGGSSRPPQSARSDAVAELTAIAVEREHRHGRVGTALVEEFLDRCDRAGVTATELMTEVGARGAAGFYAAADWEPVVDETARDGTTLRRFRRLRPSEADTVALGQAS